MYNYYAQLYSSFIILFLYVLNLMTVCHCLKILVPHPALIKYSNLFPIYFFPQSPFFFKSLFSFSCKSNIAYFISVISKSSYLHWFCSTADSVCLR